MIEDDTGDGYDLHKKQRRKEKKEKQTCVSSLDGHGVRTCVSSLDGVFI